MFSLQWKSQKPVKVSLLDYCSNRPLSSVSELGVEFSHVD